MAKKLPYMPFYPADWLIDTATLTPAQRGAYIDMISNAWVRNCGTLPDDDSKLAIYARMTASEWAENKDAILAFWRLDKRRKVWVNKRLKKERENARTKSQSARDSARARWNQKENGDANAMQSQSERNAIQSQSHKVTKTDYKTVKGVGAKSDREMMARVFDSWNAFADKNGLAKITRMSDTRKREAGARIDANGWEVFDQVLTSCAGSAFLMGKAGGRKWKLTFDHFISESGFQKCLEGNHGNKPKRAQPLESPEYYKAHQVWFQGGQQGDPPDPKDPETWKRWQRRF